MKLSGITSKEPRTTVVSQASPSPRVVAEALPDAFGGAAARSPGDVVAVTPVQEVVTAAQQHMTLETIVDRVRGMAAQGRTGVVEVDLDLTALLPRERVLACLREIGSRYPQITEFQQPETLAMIPGYTEGAIAGFVQQSGLGAKYPQLDLYNVIYSGLRQPYWSSAPWETDVLNPGLIEFMRRVRTAGGEVVFVSNRPGGSTAQARSLATLRNQGVEKPIIPLSPGGGDASAKRQLQNTIRQRYGEPVAVIDDRVTNRNAVLEGNPGAEVMSVAIAAPGFSYTDDVASSDFKIRNFEFVAPLFS